MPKKHILILGDVKSIIQHLDFFENQYSIITSLHESDSMPSEIKFAANVYGVDTPEYFDVSCFENNINDIFKIVSEIVELYGNIDSVVTTYEHTVLSAAMVRTRFNIPGLKENEAQVLRDKNKMKAMVNKKGIITPRYEKIEESTYENTITTFLNEYKKVVIKPSNQAGSYGVLITDDAYRAVEHTKNIFKENDKVSIEQFIDLPIMHFDGVLQDGHIKFLSVSKKLGTCYDYVNNKQSLTTIVLNDKDVYQRASMFVENCLSALKIESLVFHLEVFQNENDFIFLEIAGRYPGGGISKLINRTFDFDFVKASYLFDCQQEIKQIANNKFESIKSTAMHLVPVPIQDNVLIKGIKGLDNLPDNIVGSEFHGPGQIVTYSPFDPFNCLGRIYLSDEKIEEIEKSINTIVNQISFDYIKV